MIFVTVSEHYSPEFLFVPFDISEIGNNDIDARHIGIRKSKSAVKDKHIVGTFKYRHILSDLMKSAQRNDLYGSMMDILRLFLSCRLCGLRLFISDRCSGIVFIFRYVCFSYIFTAYGFRISLIFSFAVFFFVHYGPLFPAHPETRTNFPAERNKLMIR